MERRKQMFAKPYDLAQMLSGSPEKATRARTVPVLGPGPSPVPETAQRLTEPRGPGILILDIENRPNLMYIWNVWQPNYVPDGLVEASEVICFAAKWLNEEDVFFSSVFHDGKEKMLESARNLLDKADAVVTYYGKKHDIPCLNTEMLLAKISPPSPYKQIDVWETIKRQFKFPYNKLGVVSDLLGLSGKKPSPGFKNWILCMRNDPEAWQEMMEYNIQDVIGLEDLYNRVLPWIKNHPSYAAYTGNPVCPACGSSNLVKRGYAYTSVSKYQRYVCRNCGGWSQSNKRERGTTVKGVSS